MGRIALYCRVSTDDQAERNTIEAQRDFLRDYARLYSHTITGEYFDEGISGTVPLAQRPGGAALLLDAKYKCFESVVVYRLDRLGRSLMAIMDAYQQFESFNVVIRSATEPFDTSSPFGKFLFQFLGSLAELERSTINERMTLGRIRVAKNGKWASGTPPFGYMVDDEGRLTPSTHVIAGQTDAEIVHDLFTRIAQGSTSIQEAMRFTALGVPRLKREGTTLRRIPRQWRSCSILYILRNPVYTGQYVIKTKLGGDIVCTTEPIVSRHLWEQANEQLVRNRHKPCGNQKQTYLLSGLITCGACGSNYVGSRVADGKGWSRLYYRCGRQTHSEDPRRCRAGYIRADKIEDFIWQQCLEFIHNPERVITLLQEKLAAYTDKNKNVLERQRALQHALLEKEQKRDRIKHLFINGHIGPDEMEQSHRVVDQEVSKLRRAMDELQASTTMEEAYTHYYANVTALLDSLKDAARLADDQTKQYVISRMLSGIVAQTTEERRVEATCTFHFKTEPVVFTIMSRRTRVLCCV